MLLEKSLERKDADIPFRKEYRGKRTDMSPDKPRGCCGVTVDGKPLENVADKTWEWGTGYRGAMATNLARSILYDTCDPAIIPEKLVRMFRDSVVARFPFDEWYLEEHAIHDFLDVRGY